MKKKSGEKAEARIKIKDTKEEKEGQQGECPMCFLGF